MKHLNRLLTLRYNWRAETLAVVFRIALVTLFTLYLIGLALTNRAQDLAYLTLLVTSLYYVLQLIFWYHSKRKGFSLSRLFISSLADITAITIGTAIEMLLTHSFPVTFWVYFTVIIGNSFRYSPILGLVNAILSVAFFSLVVLFIKDVLYVSISPVTPFSGVVGLILISAYVLYYSLQSVTEVFRDPLTNVYNRQYIRELERTQMSKYKGLLMIDVNHFKEINDRYGHLIGDIVLIEVAKTLREALRGEDVIIRWGGDEFVILVPNAKDLRVLKKRLKDRFKKLNLEHRGNEIPVRVAIGVAEVPDNSHSFEEAMKLADEDMYRDKRSSSSLQESRDSR